VRRQASGVRAKRHKGVKALRPERRRGRNSEGERDKRQKTKDKRQKTKDKRPQDFTIK
jgi:hypothetical protein